MMTQPHSRIEDRPTARFEGRSRTATKRKALSYWIENQDALQLSLREFLGGCTASAEGTSIVFRMPAPEEKRLRDRAARLVRGFFR